MSWSSAAEEWSSYLDSLEDALASDDLDALEQLEWRPPELGDTSPTPGERAAIVAVGARARALAVGVGAARSDAAAEIRRSGELRGAARAYQQRS